MKKATVVKIEYDHIKPIMKSDGKIGVFKEIYSDNSVKVVYAPSPSKYILEAIRREGVDPNEISQKLREKIAEDKKK